MSINGLLIDLCESEIIDYFQCHLYNLRSEKMAE